MAKNPLTKKEKIIVAAVILLIVGVLVGFGVIFYYYLFATSPSKRKKMIKYYSDNNNYIEVGVTLRDTEKLQNKPNGEWFYIRVEFNDPKDKDKFDVGSGFEFPVADYNVLKDNGFEFNDGVKCVVTAAPRIWWDGGTPFAVGIKSEDGQTEYLDFDTGKNNLLHYIKDILD